MSAWIAIAAACVLIAGCSRTKRPVRAGVANVEVGDCADPESSGVVSPKPSLRHADRDLDGDGEVELVVADRELCNGGNCYWNVFSSGGSCRRYLGTISGSAIDRLARSGDDGFRSLRGWWQLGDGDRYLLQVYEFHHGGYRLVEAMVCRQEDDDRLLCASDERL